MKFIDSHHHLWTPVSGKSKVNYVWLKQIGVRKPFGDPTPIQRDYEFVEFKEESKKHSMIASVHVQCDGAIDDPILETAWIDKISRENDSPIVSVGFVDLSSKEARDVIVQHKQYPSFRGIRQIIARTRKTPSINFAKEDYISHPLWREQFELLKIYDLSFDLQLYPEQLISVAEFLQRYPEVKVVIDHVASPYSEESKLFQAWKKGLQKIAELPQVYIKISGLGMYFNPYSVEVFEKYFDVIKENFPSTKIMWGSNFPVDKLSHTYDHYLEVLLALTKDFTPQAREDVFFKTSKRFYRIL